MAKARQSIELLNASGFNFLPSMAAMFSAFTV
jgi:hypothetical protein